MTTYNLGHRVRLRTSATRRWLVVSICPADAYGPARAKVEASTDDENAAAALCRRYRGEFGPGVRIELLDQTGRGGQ